MQITIYSRKSCSPCQMLKKYLNYKGLDYKVLDIDEDSEAFEKAYNLSGMTIVPVTTIDDEVIIGYDLQKLSQLI